MRSACTFFPHEAHVFSGGCYLLMHSGETTGMEGNSFLRRAYTFVPLPTFLAAW